MARKKPTSSPTTSDSDIHTRVRSGIPREQQPQQILDDEHLKQLNSIIRECEATHNICQACHDAGIDVSPEMSTNQEQLDMARKLKAFFFPHST